MQRTLILAVIILFAEYYTLVALRSIAHRLNTHMRPVFWILYGILTICQLLGFYAMYLWADTTWPTNFLKYAVNTFIGIFIGKVLVAFLMLAGDILLLISSIIKFFVSFGARRSTSKRNEKQVITRSAFISQTALLFGAALTSGLVYGMTNRYNYKLRWVQFPVNDLPEALKGLRIAQISDIHAGSFDNAEAVSRGVDTIMQEHPDLILFTGDLVNFRADEIVPYLDIFKRLQAPLGVFSILGNHDYGDYVSWPTEAAKQNNLKLLPQYHNAMGWQLLLNENRILQWKGQPFALIGVENWSAKARFAKYGDLNKAMKGLENTVLPLKILLSHDPSYWDAAVRRDYPDIAITLSGHTHGMQFGIDIPGFKWSPVQYLYKQWAGLYQEKNQYLYVNRGFGYIGYQGRLGVLPEITLIELG